MNDASSSSRQHGRLENLSAWIHARNATECTNQLDRSAASSQRVQARSAASRADQRCENLLSTHDSDDDDEHVPLRRGYVVDDDHNDDSVDCSSGFKLKRSRRACAPPSEDEADEFDSSSRALCRSDSVFYGVGDVVQCLRADGGWHDAVLAHDHGDGRFTVEWADEYDEETEQPVQSIRLLEVPALTRASARVAHSQNRQVFLNAYKLGLPCDCALDWLKCCCCLQDLTAYHVGVVVYDREWSFFTGENGTGVSRLSRGPGSWAEHSFSHPLGETKLSYEQVEEVIIKLQKKWLSEDYNALTHNCCHFAQEFVTLLGVDDLPAWAKRVDTVALGEVANILREGKSARGVKRSTSLRFDDLCCGFAAYGRMYRGKKEPSGCPRWLACCVRPDDCIRGCWVMFSRVRRGSPAEFRRQLTRSKLGRAGTERLEVDDEEDVGRCKSGSRALTC